MRVHWKRSLCLALNIGSDVEIFENQFWMGVEFIEFFAPLCAEMHGKERIKSNIHALLKSLCINMHWSDIYWERNITKILKE